MGNALMERHDRRKYRRCAVSLRKIADRVENFNGERGSVKGIMEDLLYVVKNLMFIFMYGR